MDKQSIHWCNAETLCAPKAIGGLCFQCPEALWLRLLKSLYFPGSDFLSSVKGSQSSWIWLSLCRARPLISHGAFKALGDGLKDEWKWKFTKNRAFSDSPRITDSANVATMCWNIWKARNDCAFHGAKPCSSITGANCVIDVSDWRTAAASRGSTNHPLPVPSPHSHPATSPLPCIPTRAIYCNGSFVDDVQKEAYDITLSNTSGQVTEGRADTFYCSSPIGYEARAIYEAAILAGQSHQPTNIHSDCLELVKAINGPR
ncbi:hypothetical protein LINPERHAP2_LOCUS36049 [Linum perenne]